MRKKITLLLLLIVISLTGCGNTKTEASKENDTTINDIKIPEQGDIITEEKTPSQTEKVDENFEQYMFKIYVKNEYVETPNGMFTLLNPETGETYQADQKTYYVLNDVKYEHTPLYANEKGQYIELDNVKYYITGSGFNDNGSYYNVITEDKYVTYLYSIGN